MSLDRDIRRLEKQGRKICELLDDIKEASYRGDREKVIQLSIEYEAFVERYCINARLLPSATGLPSITRIVGEEAVKIHGIQIEFTEEGWFHLIIPSLLPKKEKGDPEFIRMPLLFAMEDFFRDSSYEKFNIPCVIAFLHQYSHEREHRRYRDHDNIELNAVVDAVAMYVLKDDNPLMCSHYYTSMEYEMDQTQVYVIPQYQFPEFLQKEGEHHAT